MTEVEVAECKKYAESKGFVIYHYPNAIESEDSIYLDNAETCYNLICNFFTSDTKNDVFMHYVLYNERCNFLTCSARADEVETVDQFKTLLDNRITRWKLCKQELKLYKLKEDF